MSRKKGHFSPSPSCITFVWLTYANYVLKCPIQSNWLTCSYVFRYFEMQFWSSESDEEHTQVQRAACTKLPQCKIESWDIRIRAKPEAWIARIKIRNLYIYRNHLHESVCIGSFIFAGINFVVSWFLLFNRDFQGRKRCLEIWHIGYWNKIL